MSQTRREFLKTAVAASVAGSIGISVPASALAKAQGNRRCVTRAAAAGRPGGVWCQRAEQAPEARYLHVRVINGHDHAGDKWGDGPGCRHAQRRQLVADP